MPFRMLFIIREREREITCTAAVACDGPNTLYSFSVLVGSSGYGTLGAPAISRNMLIRVIRRLGAWKSKTTYHELHLVINLGGGRAWVITNDT